MFTVQHFDAHSQIFQDGEDFVSIYFRSREKVEQIVTALNTWQEILVALDSDKDELATMKDVFIAIRRNLPREGRLEGTD